MNDPAAVRGFISLVGAGPGDPELLTLRGLRRLQAADAVVHDRLVGRELLAYCRPGAERHDVGKSPGHHVRHQEQINSLLVGLAREGKRVVRLKSGDPFLFGRGGEEMLALVAAGVPFEVVPGVSSALAVPAVVGIPVTHRGLATSVTIATGYTQAGDVRASHDWAALARLGGTLVFLMAVEHLEPIVEQLLAHGRSAEEPAAIIQSGTTADQQTVRAPLGELVCAARAAGIAPPAVLVVSPTVQLADGIGARYPLTAPACNPQARGCAGAHRSARGDDSADRAGIADPATGADQVGNDHHPAGSTDDGGHL